MRGNCAHQRKNAWFPELFPLGPLPPPIHSHIHNCWALQNFLPLLLRPTDRWLSIVCVFSIEKSVFTSTRATRENRRELFGLVLFANGNTTTESRRQPEPQGRRQICDELGEKFYLIWNEISCSVGFHVHFDVSWEVRRKKREREKEMRKWIMAAINWFQRENIEMIYPIPRNRYRMIHGICAGGACASVSTPRGE